MIANYFIIIIYLSFILDFIVWPIPSEASTASLLSQEKRLGLRKKIIVIGVFIITLTVYIAPLVLSIEMLFTRSFFGNDLWPFIGLLITATGRVLTIAAALVLRSAKKDGLVKHSLFRYSRNPISLGIHLVLFGLVLVFGAWYLWLGLLFTIVNIHLKIKIEEVALMRKYPGYRDYMKETPRYLIV